MPKAIALVLGSILLAAIPIVNLIGCTWVIYDTAEKYK